MQVKIPAPVSCVLALAALVACHSQASEGASGQTVDAALRSPTAANHPKLPPEPPPPVADLASEAPGLEAKLAADPAYIGLWAGPRADLDLFLTYVSELLAAGGASPDITAPLKAKHLQDAGVKLYLVFARTGVFPGDFTDHLTKHLAAVKGEPHLGTWSPWSKGSPVRDYTALAAWSNREDAGYFREHIAAKSTGGPIPWGADETEHPARPYLVFELDALNWLALLAPLTADEKARQAALVEQARQPKLGQDFKLGDFTYNVKSVQVVDAVGNGFAAKRASEGAEFVLVKYVIQNDANETRTVMTDDFRIVDAQSREFRPSSDANTALAMSGNKDLIVSEVQPGLKRNMVTAFEMPDVAAKGTFTLVIPEKGLLGTGSVRITLR